MRYTFLKQIKTDFAFQEDDPGSFSGYAALFGPVDDHLELCHGCFDRNAQDWQFGRAMPKLLWQHNPDWVLGPVRNMGINEKGLRIYGKLLYEDIDEAKKVRALAQTKSIGGFSIGFDLIDPPVRENGRIKLTAIDVKEVSFATFPRIEGATIDVMMSESESLDQAILALYLSVLNQKLKECV